MCHQNFDSLVGLSSRTHRLLNGFLSLGNSKLKKFLTDSIHVGCSEQPVTAVGLWFSLSFYYLITAPSNSFQNGLTNHQTFSLHPLAVTVTLYLICFVFSEIFGLE